jgi:uncharacterized protein with GYD domain
MATAQAIDVDRRSSALLLPKRDATPWINSAGPGRVESGLAHEGIAYEAIAYEAIAYEAMGAGRRKAYNCKVFAQNDPHDVEVAMKYVLLGNLSPEYASKQSERVKKAKAKLDKLGIKIESIHYTQGHYDFVDIVDAPNPQAMLAFSVWYSTQRLGRIQSMPAFDPKSFETAIKDATG